ncbi:GNAT family N-acetyltransferase [Sphingomonas sp.]|uniref:GNAT family N-acetyltransferase n=1 Tax=Sphingomonas sp. TaxID=28214 RepID=UPI002FC90F3A
MIVIRQDDLSGEATRGLVALHLAEMHAFSPPGHVFALDSSGLMAPEVTVWTAWIGEDIAGMAALRQLPDIGELKSMRIHPQYLRKGIAAALLEHIIAEARARGLERLSLETGSGPAFEPALALYRKRGFSEGEAFGNYVRSDFNRFLHQPLAGPTL